MKKTRKNTETKQVEIEDDKKTVLENLGLAYSQAPRFCPECNNNLDACTELTCSECGCWLAEA